MKITQVLNATGGRISGGTEFTWKCYGPDARYIDISDLSGNEVCNFVHDTKTQEVYEVDVHVTDDNEIYRWMNLKYVAEYNEEANQRSIDPCVTYDNICYTYVLNEKEILDLAHQVVNQTYVTPAVDTTDDIDTEMLSDLLDHQVASEYEVTVNTTHIFAVRATSMEQAAINAKLFTSGMKPGNSIAGVIWSDSYVSKESVSKDLVTLRIEE